jgi:L-rhamnose mutarotase
MKSITEVYFATLLPDKVALYQELHDRIPEQIETNLREDGIESLEIYRSGLELCMIVRKISGKPAALRNVDPELELWWQSETGNCFETFWQLSSPIYHLESKGGNTECD